MTVGFFAPMPPVRTGVAEYSAALLRGLRKFGDVRMNAVSADVCLYHIGNNHLHRSIYRTAFERPGAAVLHDAVLHHFFLGTLTREEYVEEFVYNYGEWMRPVAVELWEARARSAQDPLYFKYPMLKRIAGVSRAVIVHNPAAARVVREHAPDATVHEVPHLFEVPSIPPGAALRWRERNGVPPLAFLFGVFGHLRESKRLHSVLSAFERIRAAGLNAMLLVAGAFASQDMERALMPCLRKPGILYRPFGAEPEFWLRAAAVDACINLRYPAAGETSGIAIRLMGIGKPVIMTAGEEVSRIPDSACLKVDAGLAEESMLADCMTVLAASPDTAWEIGRRAAEHIAIYHGLEATTRQYWEILCAHSDPAS